MHQTTLPCSCCSLPLTFPEGQAVANCPACGTVNAAPRATGDTLLTLRRAVTQRLACDFASAEQSYQQVLLYHPDEHEALWGRLLCHYGVEYVQDAATGRHLPTVHTVRARPLQAQSDFHQACSAAPEAVRARYQRDAAYIDDAQASIRRLAQSGPAYDLFICHKTTLADGQGYTEDFRHASQLFHFLKKNGLHPFFAPECLSGLAGQDYEAAIFHALHTSRVMLLVCSDAGNLESPWVRSEWTRFLEMTDDSPQKRLIPLLYNGFAPAGLPEAIRLRHLQALDMNDLNASQQLLELCLGVKGGKVIAGPAAAPAAAPVPEAAVEQTLFLFPRPLNSWRRLPRWVICRNDARHTPLAPIKWGQSSAVPLTEPVPVTVHADRVSPLWWLWLPLVPAAIFVGVIAVIFLLLPMLVTLATILGFAGGIAWAVWYLLRIRNHFRRIVSFFCEPGKRYRLTLSEDGSALTVEELEC